MRLEVFEKGRDCVCEQKTGVESSQMKSTTEEGGKNRLRTSKRARVFKSRDDWTRVHRLLHVCESLWYAMRFSWHKPFDISVHTIYFTMGTCSFLLMYICVCQQVSSPSVHPLLQKLRDAERQRAHKVVPAGQVPVPDLHRQPAVLVRLLQITVRHKAHDGDRQSQRNQAQRFISHFSDKQITDLIFWLCHWCPERESFLTM